MTLFSEKMLICNRWISALMSNLIKKSWKVSNVHCSGLHASHNGPEHWNLFKNCFNINECMTGFVTNVGKGLEYSISHKKLYSFACEFHHLWTKFRGLAHCASCNCNLPKYYLAGIIQLEIIEYRKDRRKICEVRKLRVFYCRLNLFYYIKTKVYSFKVVVIFNTNQNKVSWCYIENYHNFERNEDRETVFLKWTNFSCSLQNAFHLVYWLCRKMSWRKRKEFCKNNRDNVRSSLIEQVTNFLP